MKLVTTLCKGSLFGSMRFFLATPMPSSSALRHRRQVASMRAMLALMLAQAGIVPHVMRMLAAPRRARIPDPDSMDDVRIQAAFAPGDARDAAALAVLYGL